MKVLVSVMELVGIWVCGEDCCGMLNSGFLFIMYLKLGVKLEKVIC